MVVKSTEGETGISDTKDEERRVGKIKGGEGTAEDGSEKKGEIMEMNNTAQ